MKKIYLLIFLFISFTAFAQTKNFNGKSFQKRSEKWFTPEGFEVNKTITIKFKTGATKRSSLTGRTNILGYTDIEVPANTDILDYAQSLKSDPDIESVSINAYGKYGAIPNDTRYAANQWYLPKISMPAAWDHIMGTGSCIRVAVLDSEVDWTHEDIGLGAGTFQNIWLNPGEDAWANANDPATGNNLDDDGDGFVDNWKGWDFDLNNNNTRDGVGHGTRVAGIIAAKTNNSLGVAGIAGGNNAAGVQLLPVQIGANQPNGAVIDDAIIYAVTHGARVIQMSLTVPQTAAIDAAILFAINNGAVVVCAAGNNSGAVSYPASNPGVISVGATDNTDHRAGFSNSGLDLTIAAPGVGIESTTLTNGYNSEDGTSFAAPQISGIVALMLTINPGLTPNDVRNIITASGDKVGGYTYTSGRSLELGFGRINALKCMQGSMTTFTSDAIVCTTKNYNMTNLPAGSTVTWNASPAGLVNISMAGSTATFTRLINGIVQVQPVVTNACGSYFLSSKKFAVGIPMLNTGSITFDAGVPQNPLEVCNGDAGRGTFKYTDLAGNISNLNNAYGFDVVGGSNYDFFPGSGHNYDYEISNSYTGTLHVPVYVKNPCGWSTAQFILDVEVQNCRRAAYSITPNPGRNIVTITAEQQGVAAKSAATGIRNNNFRATILDGNGRILKTQLSKGSSFLKIDVSNIPNGVYILRMESGKDITTEKLIVNR